MAANSQIIAAEAPTGTAIAAQEVGGKKYSATVLYTSTGDAATFVTARNNTVPVSNGGDGFVAVAAGQTDQVLGGAGAIGDYLSHVVIVPATTSPGAVLIQDGAGTEITVFAGGANSISNLVSFVIPLGLRSKLGGWRITTGVTVSVIAAGTFSA